MLGLDSRFVVGSKILVGMNDGAGEQLFEVPESDEARPGRGGVDKTFRAYQPDQMWLMPPSVDDWVAEDHLARFVDELVEDVFDLDVFYAAYTEKRGFPPYDPRLMIKVLLYGYTTGVRASRDIEKHCHENVPFRFLAANRSSVAFPCRNMSSFHLKSFSMLIACLPTAGTRFL